jgi:hypothetical protein
MTKNSGTSETTRTPKHTVTSVLDNVEKIPEAGCWIWLGHINKKEYARVYIDGKMTYVHRWLYQKLFGSICDLTIDHLCRVHCCINPAHLEAVPNSVNVLRGEGVTANNSRKTHCIKGHQYTPDNTFTSKYGWRACLICRRSSNLKSWRKKHHANDSRN